MFVGNQEGIDIYYKLGVAEDGNTQAYINSVRNAAQKYRNAFFTDVVEQRKKALNNQKIFMMYFDDTDQKWHIELFMVPKSA